LFTPAHWHYNASYVGTLVLDSYIRFPNIPGGSYDISISSSTNFYFSLREDIAANIANPSATDFDSVGAYQFEKRVHAKIGGNLTLKTNQTNSIWTFVRFMRWYDPRIQ
jgi:hypothetical protein